MAIRTTDNAVEGIIQVNAAIPLTPFIEIANSLVTELCLASGYDAARLELIERWLSAHFYAVREARTVSEKAGSVSRKFQSKVDLGLDVTHYGQQVKRIDTAGNLAALDERSKKGKIRSVGMTWLGTGNSTGDDISK